MQTSDLKTSGDMAGGGVERIEAAWFDPALKQINLRQLGGAGTLAVPVAKIAPLSEAAPEDVAVVEITSFGEVLTWKRLGLSFRVAGFFAADCGSPAWMLRYAATTGVEMTRRQAQAVEYLRREIFKHDALGSREGYEYKSFEVTRGDGGRLVYVLSVVGLVGDEENAARLVRVRRHIAVGVRGGLSLMNAKGGKKVTGRSVLWEQTY